METNLESLDEVIRRNRLYIAVFCPYQEVRTQCHYCAYCVHAPSEVLESFCVFSSIYRPSSQFRSWFYAR